MYGPGSDVEYNGDSGEDYSPPPRKKKTKQERAKEREEYLLERKTNGVAILKNLKKNLGYEDSDEIDNEDIIEVLLYLYEEVKSLRKRLALLEPKTNTLAKYKK